jgi:hypothetical protein
MTKASPVAGIEIAGKSEPMFAAHNATPPGTDRWRAAEGRLYPLITVDPALYEAAVTLVCEVADVLRSKCATVAELVHVDAADVLRQCPSAHLTGALGVDPDTAFDAACAYRWRELRVNQHAKRDASAGGRP